MYSQEPPKGFSLKPELLSPAGDWESLQAAILNGADAVYLGTAEFSARANARNFSQDEMTRAAKYSHDQGVRVYLTVNTLVKNAEVDRYFATVSRAYGAGVDGVIVQHLSFVPILKKNFPELAVFVSTQGAIGNLASARLI